MLKLVQNKLSCYAVTDVVGDWSLVYIYALASYSATWQLQNPARDLRMLQAIEVWVKPLSKLNLVHLAC